MYDNDRLLEQQEESQEDIAEEEEKQHVTLEDKDTIVAGFKTLMYAYMCFINFHGCYFSVGDNLETQRSSSNTNTTTNTCPTSKRAKRAKHV